MRMGWRVRRTVSSKARHLALNSEIDTSFMAYPIVVSSDHSQIYGPNRKARGIRILHRKGRSPYSDQAISKRSKDLRAAVSCPETLGASGPVFSFNSRTIGKLVCGAD